MKAIIQKLKKKDKRAKISPHMNKEAGKLSTPEQKPLKPISHLTIIPKDKRDFLVEHRNIMAVFEAAKLVDTKSITFLIPELDFEKDEEALLNVLKNNRNYFKDNHIGFHYFQGQSGETPKKLVQAVKKLEEETASDPVATVNFVVGPYGRKNVLDAVKNILADGVKPQEVDEELLLEYLSFPQTFDLIIAMGQEEDPNVFYMPGTVTESDYSEFLAVPTPFCNSYKGGKGGYHDFFRIYSTRNRKRGGLNGESEPKK